MMIIFRSICCNSPLESCPLCYGSGQTGGYTRTQMPKKCEYCKGIGYSCDKCGKWTDFTAKETGKDPKIYWEGAIQ